MACDNTVAWRETTKSRTRLALGKFKLSKTFRKRTHDNKKPARTKDSPPLVNRFQSRHIRVVTPEIGAGGGCESVSLEDPFVQIIEYRNIYDDYVIILSKNSSSQQGDSL